MTKLVVRCSWCSRILGVKNGNGAEGVSDGMCSICAGKNFPKYFSLWRRFKMQLREGFMRQPPGIKWSRHN